MKNNQDISNILDYHSRKSYTNLINDFKKREMTIVCGAGVSVSAGLPTWHQYLQKIASIFLLHWKDLEGQNKKYLNVAPKSMSINMLDEYFEYKYPNFSVPENFANEDPLVLAQLIKNCIEPANWRYLLRNSLYGEKFLGIFSSRLIDYICQLAKQNSNFTSIMTYNYDDLLETIFENLNFKHTSIVSENHYKNHLNFPIYHMHGILPYKGGLEGKIYLCEEDYLTDIIQPNSWYNQLHANKLTSTTCLFIGLSFNDPSLKRKLATHRLNPNHYHYAFLTHKESEFERRKFLLVKNELLRLKVRVIKYAYDEKHENLCELIKQFNKDIKHNGN